MADKLLNTRMVQKHDIEENWLKAVNFTPKQGELIIYDIDATHDYERLKIGDGVTLVSDLPFVDDHLSDAIDKIASGSTVVEKANEATHATSADNATSADKASTADSATKATQDENGNVITDTYETKVDAAQKLIDAKSYADTLLNTSDEVAQSYFAPENKINLMIENAISGINIDRWEVVPPTLGCASNGEILVCANGKNGLSFTKDLRTWGTYPSLVAPLDLTETPTTNTSWEHVVYGAGKFLVFASHGNKYLYSTNGTTWSEKTLSAYGDWSACTYGNGKFVIAQNGSDIVFYSTDGLNWTQSTASSVSGWYSMAYGNGKFVMISYSGTVACSSDAITWTEVTLQGSQFGGLAFGSDVFVVSINPNAVLCSSDGISWTEHQLPSECAQNFAIAHNGNMFILCGVYSKFVLCSKDGQSWKHYELDREILPMCATNVGSKFFFGGYDNEHRAAFVSVDGIFAKSGHDHSIADVYGLSAILESKAEADDLVGENVTGRTFLVNSQSVVAPDNNPEIFNDYENNIATGIYSHAEGSYTAATAGWTHAEGYSTVASGIYAHSQGLGTKASGESAHAEGKYTIAAGEFSHVEGKYNVADTENKYIHIAGNGEKTTARSNAHTLDWSGNAWFAGDVYVGSTSGTNKDEGSVKLVSADDVNALLASLITVEDIDEICGASIVGVNEVTY